MTELFYRLTIHPIVKKPSMMELGEWQLHGYAERVTQPFIDLLLDRWLAGMPVPVSFLHRKEWHTGNAYIVSVTPELQTLPETLNCAFYFIGTGNLESRKL